MGNFHRGSKTAANSASNEITQLVQGKIKDHRVLVFSKSYCPYCAKSKALLQQKNVDFTVIELDEEADGDKMQNALKEISGQKTVPNIFIGGEHVGGNSDLQEAEANGKLDEMLKENNIRH